MSNDYNLNRGGSIISTFTKNLLVKSFLNLRDALPKNKIVMFALPETLHLQNAFDGKPLERSHFRDTSSIQSSSPCQRVPAQFSDVASGTPRR